jgi:SOS-response transcriptional repressor LexA
MPTASATRPVADPAAIRRMTDLGLTETSARVFHYLFVTTMMTGIQPTFRDVCAAFGWSTTNSVSTHMVVLARKGWVAPGGGKNRAVRFKKRPDGLPFKGFCLPEDKP